MQVRSQGPADKRNPTFSLHRSQSVIDRVMYESVRHRSIGSCSGSADRSNTRIKKESDDTELTFKPLVVSPLQIPRSDVVRDSVSKHMAEGVLSADIPSSATNDHSELCLIVQCLCAR